MRLTMRVVLSSGVSFGEVLDVKTVVSARLAMSGLLKKLVCNVAPRLNRLIIALAAKPNSFATMSFLTDEVRGMVMLVQVRLEPDNGPIA